LIYRKETAAEWKLAIARKEQSISQYWTTYMLHQNSQQSQVGVEKMEKLEKARPGSNPKTGERP
jgi:hypothetical protein